MEPFRAAAGKPGDERELHRADDLTGLVTHGEKQLVVAVIDLLKASAYGAIALDSRPTPSSGTTVSNNAQASAESAAQALSAIVELQAQNPQPGQVTVEGPSGIPNVYVNQVIASYSFTPTSDCVGTGGCTVTGDFHVQGYNVYTMVSCVTPTSDPDVCVNTGSGPQVILDVLAVLPFTADHSASIRITHQQLLESSLRALPGILFGDYIGCAKRLTGNGGSFGDCAWVAAELIAPFALKAVATAVTADLLRTLVGDDTVPADVVHHGVPSCAITTAQLEPDVRSSVVPDGRRQ